MYSRISLFLCSVVIVAVSFLYYPRFTKSTTESVISWDVSGYYWYLPSILIYHDLKKQSFKDEILQKYKPTNLDFQQGVLLPNGNYVMKYSAGMSIMYLPFFLTANCIAKPLGYPNDGFSKPYQVSIQIGGVLISILGLWTLRRLLMFYFADRVIAICLFLIACGTNYLNYAAIDSGMSHTWLFTLYSLLLYFTIRYYRESRLIFAVLIGLLVGLLTITRPTEIISCLIPVLWPLNRLSKSSIRQHLSFLFENRFGIFISLFAAVAVMSIQLIYWKYVTGEWLFYSYGSQGFYWTNPYLVKYSLNYRCGWLVYSPMMSLAVIAILPFILWGRNRVAIISFLLLFYYLVSAWDIWWYGGRAMIQSYPIFAFPLATMVHSITKHRIVKLTFNSLVFVLLYYNTWVLIQYHTGGLYDDNTMSKEFYWHAIGRWRVSEQSFSLLDCPDFYQKRTGGEKVLLQENFDTCSSCPLLPMAGKQKRMMVIGSKINGATPYYVIPIPSKDYNWLRAYINCSFSTKEVDIWKMSKMCIRVLEKGHIIKDNVFRFPRIMNENISKTVYVDMKLPSTKFDQILFVVWNDQSEKEVYISDIKVTTFHD
ncbi:MAG: hypothetical protein JNM41_10095 [Flavipsychrobacter sp.]|nr:hypothetical protein [Flavipsychrobacter sp.]